MALDRSKEIALTHSWEAFYQSSVKEAAENGALLIVLTHNPPHDWSNDCQLSANCAYFFGHNHRNVLEYYSESNTFVFADNQIGYHNETVSFRTISIFTRYNPLAHLNDGVHHISVEQYRSFNWYNCLPISGTKRIERKIEQGCEFVVIKKDGYYGFFILCADHSNKSMPMAYICDGGNIRIIAQSNSLDYLIENFSLMVDAYQFELYPYRNALEQVSREVKRFGGSGKIHGLIVDIDFYNHVILDPLTGEFTPYYSPAYGFLRPYSSIRDLLEEQCPALLPQYEPQETELSTKILTKKNLPSDVSDYVHILIKDSPYVYSNKLNKLHRLFDAHTLRAWDDTLLIKYQNRAKQQNEAIKTLPNSFRKLLNDTDATSD